MAERKNKKDEVETTHSPELQSQKVNKKNRPWLKENLKKMIEQAGFEDCRYLNLSGGIVALHIAYKY